MPTKTAAVPTPPLRPSLPLSHPFTDDKKHFDVIVVGSGYGAAVCAARLAEAGFDVCVLERGLEYRENRHATTDEASRGRFPATLWQTLGHLQADWMNWWRANPLGLFDFRIGPSFDFLVGCGLGGGSLINANVSMEPDPAIFDWQRWPSEIRQAAHEGPPLGAKWSPASREDAVAEGGSRPLSYYYALARAVLRPAVYPDPGGIKPRSLAGLELGAATLDKARFRRAELNLSYDKAGPNAFGVEQGPCVGCGNCVAGCNFDAKNSVNFNYLPLARHFGATLFTRCEVDLVKREKSDGGHVRYEVEFKHYLGEGLFPEVEEVAFSATAVVLGAGSLGSTEILLRSHDHGGLTCAAPLGTRFSTNGNLLSFGYNSRERVDSVGTGRAASRPADRVGPTILGIVEVGDGTQSGEIVIEDGHFPTPLAIGAWLALPFAALFSAFSRIRGGFARLRDFVGNLFRRGQMLARSPVYLSMGHDGARGTLRLGLNRRINAVWEHPRDLPLYLQADGDVQRLNQAVGATHVRDPLWNARAGSQLISVHPLGGCPMGDDGNSGAVDHAGRVFRGDTGRAADTYHGLYVADGAIIPDSLGVNPLLTITALAERVAEHAASDLGRPFRHAPSTALPVEETVLRVVSAAGSRSGR